MPISLRAAALRTALERALDEPVHLLARGGHTRLHATAPAPSARSTWERVLNVLRTADTWGSTDSTGTPEIWAEVHDEVTTCRR